VSAGEWTSIRVRSPRDRPATISALFALGAEGIQELDDDIITHIRDLDRSRATAVLADIVGSAAIEYAAPPRVDWSAEWRSRITAHDLGRLVVTPPWLARQFPESRRIVIDPGMAFGTGEHETTRGVLRLMQRVVRAGDVVADLGAGSAVLSIGAAKLGARRVIAIELDADAIGNAEANVAANGAGVLVSVLEGDARLLLPLVAPVRVVVANIISSVLVELLPVIHASLDGDGAAILGGILTSEREDMTDALRRRGWRIVESDEEGLWWSVTIAPQ
jgi:ribosomal protein L11 methyltransferase